MKTLKTIGILSVLASGSQAGASEYNHQLRVNVPFAFVVAGQQFAPGEYDVKETDTGVITVQGEGKASAVISTPWDSAKPSDVSALRFTNDSDRNLVGVAVEGAGRRAIPVRAAKERKLTIASH